MASSDADHNISISSALLIASMLYHMLTLCNKINISHVNKQLINHSLVTE